MRCNVLLTAVVVHLANARNYDIVFTGIEGYETNPEYVSPESFIRVRRADKSELPSLYHTMVFSKPLPNNTEVEVQLYEMRDNKQVPSWLKYKRNLCEYILMEKRPIFNEFIKIYQLNTCPVEGIHKLENYRPDDHLLPPVLPGPDVMMLGIKIYSGAAIIIKWGAVFKVDRMKRLRPARGPRPGPQGSRGRP